MSITPGTDGWVEWTGGENPVPGQTVQVRWRDNTARLTPDAEYDSEAWSWEAHDLYCDIIAYRVVTPPVSPSPSDLDGAVERLTKFVEEWPHWQYADHVNDAVRLVLQAFADLRAAKWDVKHVDTMNEAVAQGLAIESQAKEIDDLNAALSEAREQARLDGECIESIAKIPLTTIDLNYTAVNTLHARGSLPKKVRGDAVIAIRTLRDVLEASKARLATRKGETA